MRQGGNGPLGRLSTMTTESIRFILLGHPRTGSHMISSNLERHKALLTFGELFIDEEDVRNRWFGAGPRFDTPYRTGEDGAEFLERNVFFTASGDALRGSGFKIFYGQARRDAAGRKAWDYLIANRDIRVIHLTRWNLLDCLVSQEVALRTGEWVRAIDAPPPEDRVPPFELTIDQCEQMFNRIFAARRWAERAFADHPRLDLDYERDVCGDFAGTVRRVFEFLGVEPLEGEVLLHKLRKKPAAAQVTNYDELREHFRHTVHDGYFATDVGS